MKQRLPAFFINLALAVIAALTLFPLLWMLSASFMAPGEASTFPPPLCRHPRCTTTGAVRRARHRPPGSQQPAVASAATLLSLAFNLTAGYAFAKLPFPGRERVFRTLLGALVIPGQVAMMPLFLLLKQMGLVNTYAGALVPWLASVFGIFWCASTR
jgi:multiple sugar transport system permease protein